MDRLRNDLFCQSIQPPNQSIPDFPHLPPSNTLLSDSRPEVEHKGSAASRKVQKADREKLRRDRLNEQFTELGSTLDADRPKNDKASILVDTIQVLKDLTAQVDRLKAEYAALTEESRELTQEKNDLREEKASLKSDIENLNIQYQQRHRATFPWGMDPSVMMHPPTYPFPVPVPIPQGPMPMHPSMQPYQFFANQNPSVVPNPCSTFMPYLDPNTVIEQQSTQYVSPPVQPVSRSHISRKQKQSDQEESKTAKTDDSIDVATDLELKTPGSTADQDASSGQRKLKTMLQKESSEGNSSSRCSSSRNVQASSSNSIVGGTRDDAVEKG